MEYKITKNEILNKYPNKKNRIFLEHGIFQEYSRKYGSKPIWNILENGMLKILKKAFHNKTKNN